jgi:homoserine kinase
MREQSSSSHRRVRVRVPASTANLGPGFDAIGMALSMYAWIEMAPAEQTKLMMSGAQMRELPADKSNLLFQMAQLLYQEAGIKMPELEISVHSEIPLTRGLGSSAAAVVGALGAANVLLGQPFPEDELFRIATTVEGHPDNVGAALFGGIVTAVWDGARVSYVRMDPPADLTTLVAIPSYQLSTGAARKLLPEQVSRQDAIFNLSRASLLIAALANGRLDLIQCAMADRLHQPYRASLVAGLDVVLQNATEHGALGAALSGAGPTAIAFVNHHSPRKDELEQFMQEAMAVNGAAVETKWLKPSLDGLQLVPIGGEHER